MQCEYCGRALKPDDWQCPGCGAPVEKNKKTSKEQERTSEEKHVHQETTIEINPQKGNTVYRSSVGAWLSRADYGGFLRRTIALWIDLIVVGFIFAVIDSDELYMLLYCIYEIIGTSYIFKGTTIGRKAMNIRVVNSHYEPLTLGQAVIRLVCKGISTISMGIGFLMIIFTKKKQSLHDRLCETYVIRIRR
ncbi:MAG: RDD family protein [Cellulosilyticum sp.]|nr:RDD family protein [Cellulosilyticum sp.]